MTTRKYSSRAQQTTLSSALTSVATSMVVGSGANLMGGKTPSATETYTVVIDPDTALEEIVDVHTYSSGNTLSITRPIDGSSAVAHSAGAIIRHMVIGRDLQEANTHIENTTTAHGATGFVVGTTNAQTLTNKTLTAPIIAVISNTGALTLPTSTDTLIGKATTDTLTNKTLDTAGTGNVLKINGTTISGTSGTGSVVLAVSPTVTGTALATNLTASGTVTAASFVGPLTGNITGNITGNVTGNLTGNVTGNVSGSSGSTTGNAATATALATGRTISLTGDVSGTSGSFDGTGNASITAAIAANTIVDADINASAAIALSKLASDPLARANHTGTQLAATVSNFDTQVRTSRLDQMAAPTAAVALNAQKITGLADPTLAQDAATKAYTDLQITNLIAAAPGALDTLDELAAALGDDASFATTVTNSLAAKLPLAGGTMSGVIAMGTNKITGVGDPTAAQDVVTKYYLDNTVLAPSNLTGPITSVGAATSIASQTGTGTKFVMDTSPTLVTPVLGVATATSINSTSIPSSKTLVATDSTTYVVPSQTSNSGKFLTTDGTTSSWGTAVTSVASASGTRISIGGTAAAPTVDLVTTAVTPATYTSTTLTVDAYGRITSASNGSGGGVSTARVYFMKG